MHNSASKYEYAGNGMAILQVLEARLDSLSSLRPHPRRPHPRWNDDLHGMCSGVLVLACFTTYNTSMDWVQVLLRPLVSAYISMDAWCLSGGERALFRRGACRRL